MRFSVWISLGLVLFGMTSGVQALAVVESRTGDRKIQDSSMQMRSSPVVTPQSEDRVLRTVKQMDALQQELSELRGLIETQAHEIQQLKKSQQDLYLDLDKRSTSPTTSSLPVSPSPPTPKAPPVVITEKSAYEAAYDFVRTKRYPEAIAAFQDYLQRFKEGEYAANATYWLGEIHMAEWHMDKKPELLDQATLAFSDLMVQFPKHPKVPDALLKLGLIEIEKGNIESARQYLTEVKEHYPGSAAARIAATRLEKL